MHKKLKFRITLDTA